MKTLFQEAIVILVVVGALSNATITNSTPKPRGSATEAVETLGNDYAADQDSYESEEVDEILFTENKPCPRDCICTTSNGPSIARCSRLEVGTQQFGGDIVDLVVENVDSRFPIVLSDNIFKKLGLQQLTHIKIANSFIKSVSPNAFLGLNELYSVNLSANNINKLDPNTFAFNKKLSLLTLSENPSILSKLMTSTSQYFLNSSAIQELDISKSGIKTLPKNVFSKLTSLMYINLSGNKLQEIDSALFADLPDLEEVDLSDNFLRSIPEDLFANNDEMTTLKIGGNPIKTVIGVQIKELLALDISAGKIKTIGPSMFDGMDLINNLNLNGNGIEKIHNQAFRKLKDLNYLELSHNKLDFVSDQLIKDNTELDVVKISHNSLLRSLPSSGFVCSNSQFNIYLFDASHCSIGNIQNDTFQTMPSLSQLDLSNNKIKKIGFAFQKLLRLVDLNLSYNFITQLFKHNFENNRDLTKINLAGNPLITVSPEVFVGNPNLARLDISFCKLTTLWEKKNSYSNSALSNLQFLNASNNDIKSINYQELEISRHLYTLDISENPLECTKDFEVLMVWLGQHKISPSTKEILISNLATSKNPDNRYKWEFLAKKTCTPVQPLSKTVETNDKIADEEKDVTDKMNKNSNKDNVDDYVEEDYYDDDDDTTDSLNDVVKSDIVNSTINKMKNDQISKNVKESGSILTDITELSTNTEKEIHKLTNTKIQLDDTSKYVVEKNINISLLDDTNVNNVILPGLEFKPADDDDNEIDIYEVDTDKLADGVIERKFLGSIPSLHQLHTRHLWMGFGIIAVICILIITILKVAVLKKEVRKGLPNISVTVGSQGRVKKDCGLVYQQLSEDLTGPKTPIVSRYAPLSNVTTNATNISYQSSPFHHSNITPESV